MDKDQIQKIIDSELAKKEEFNNWHGINKKNLKEHLVEPYCVTVYSDQNDSGPLDMRVMLYEYPNEEKGYRIFKG